MVACDRSIDQHTGQTFSLVGFSSTAGEGSTAQEVTNRNEPESMSKASRYNEVMLRSVCREKERKAAQNKVAGWQKESTARA